jgi:glycosyltransferase involved in cell wall biosynthesis
MQDNQTKTVCFFNTNKAWGGGEKWHLTTAKELERRGFKSILVTHVDSQLKAMAIQERMNVFPFRVSNLSFLNPFKIFVMALFLKTKKIDAIICNLPADLKLGGIAAKLAGVKKIIYRRGMPHPLRNTWLNRFLFTKILTDVVVNSQEIGRNLKQGNESWFPEEKMTLIYNGVDFSKTWDKDKKLYQKKGDEIVIGNAGRLTEQKGQKYLIEVAELLKKENVNFIILIAGEGELRQQLQNSIKEKGLQDNVKLLGHIEDMASFMNSLDVFVFPSLFEGSANTLIETIFYAVPVIAWDVSSNSELIENRINGLLIPFDDKDMLKNAILEIDLKSFQNLGKPIEKFSYTKNVDKLVYKLLS